MWRSEVNLVTVPLELYTHLFSVLLPPPPTGSHSVALARLELIMHVRLVSNSEILSPPLGLKVCYHTRLHLVF